MKVISSKFSFDTSNIIGLNSELKAMYCYEMFKKVNKGFLVVTNSLYEANTLYQYINNYTLFSNIRKLIWDAVISSIIPMVFLE